MPLWDVLGQPTLGTNHGHSDNYFDEDFMKYKVLTLVPGAISLYLRGLPTDDFPCAIYFVQIERAWWNRNLQVQAVAVHNSLLNPT